MESKELASRGRTNSASGCAWEELGVSVGQVSCKEEGIGVG